MNAVGLTRKDRYRFHRIAPKNSISKMYGRQPCIQFSPQMPVPKKEGAFFAGSIRRSDAKAWPPNPSTPSDGWRPNRRLYRHENTREIKSGPANGDPSETSLGSRTLAVFRIRLLRKSA